MEKMGWGRWDKVGEVDGRGRVREGRGKLGEVGKVGEGNGGVDGGRGGGWGEEGGQGGGISRPRQDCPV